MFFSKKAALKKFLIFFQIKPPIFWKRKPRKNIYISGEEIFLYFWKQNFAMLSETERSYTSGNRTFSYFLTWNFLILRERYIQNLSIFRFLTYLELDEHLESWYTQNPRHIQNTVKHLRWNVLENWETKPPSYTCSWK